MFWLSLFPFSTAWMGENNFAAVPSAIYGVVLLMAAIAYRTLQQAIIASQGSNSILKKAVGKDWKGKASILIYLGATFAAFWLQWAAQFLFVLVAAGWLVPDRRIEKVLVTKDNND
jgi:uncharacterized membrane protein